MKMTLAGARNIGSSKKCFFSDRWWDTQKACADAHGVSQVTVGRWLRKGYTKPPEARVVEFEGVQASSWDALGRKFGVQGTTVQGWAERGGRPVPGETARKRCCVHNKIYESEVAAAKAHGVTRQAISCAILRGCDWAYFVDEDAGR